MNASLKPTLASLVDITLSGEKFSVDGIQQLAADVGIDPNDSVLFVFAWKCNCQQICEFTKQEFLAGLQDPNIRYAIACSFVPSFLRSFAQHNESRLHSRGNVARTTPKS